VAVRSASSAVLFALVLALGCGSAPPPPPASSGDASTSAAEAAARNKAAKEATAKPEEPKTLPTTCTPDGDGFCMPEESFVKRLCGGVYPDVALLMFGKDTPWTRAYLRRTMEAWSASGGHSSNDKVELDEEILVLSRRAPDTGGMKVSGAGGSYEAFRWDGTCVSLMDGELTPRLPPETKYAKIPWKQLDTKTREALSNDAKVGPVVEEYRKECKGASFGSVSAKCEKMDKKLSKAIVSFVRAGGAIPMPPNLP
jgi:hypothetical protein